MEIPPVERVVAVNRCPQNATTWRNGPRLPSKTCKLMAALIAEAYSTASQAASALHAMAILQVHQVKALKQMYKGSSDPRLMQELRLADFALRVTKVMLQSLGKAKSTLVIQEHHIWLNLEEIKDVDKVRFLKAPISKAGLFGDIVEGFSQQTEAIQHILPRRDAPPATAAPQARPQSAHRRGRPPTSPRAVRCGNLLFLRRL